MKLLLFFLLRFAQLVTTIYCMWIMFRVLNDWLGLLLAIIGTILFPITFVPVFLSMQFFPTTEAGALSLLPGSIFIYFLETQCIKLKVQLRKEGLW